MNGKSAACVLKLHLAVLAALDQSKASVSKQPSSSFDVASDAAYVRRARFVELPWTARQVHPWLAWFPVAVVSGRAVCCDDPRVEQLSD
eukprot:2809830-Pleurochrysis_carterae.AAC.2